MGAARKTKAPAEPKALRPRAEDAEDPYAFRSGGIAVRVRFSGGRPIEEVVSHYLAMRDNADSAMGTK